MEKLMLVINHLEKKGIRQGRRGERWETRPIEGMFTQAIDLIKTT